MRTLNLTDKDRASKICVTYDGIAGRFEAYMDGDSVTGFMLSAHRRYAALIDHLREEGFADANIIVDATAQYVRRQQQQ